MKIVLTCGHPYSGYQFAHNALAAAGLAQAKPSRREGLTSADLHQKMAKACGLDLLGEGPLGQLLPGKVWQNLAVDLLLGNLDQEAWGWADGNLIGFLEFWRDFDPQIRFLLVYSEPAFAVGQMLRNGLLAHLDIRRAVASWEAGNAEILRFYNRNTDRCLLVNAAVAIHAPAELADKATAAFGLDIGSLPPGYQVDWTGFSAIASRLANGLMEGYEEAAALYQELESSADLDGTAVSRQEAEKPQVWQEFSQLLADLDQASRRALEQTELAAAFQAQLAQVAEVRDGQARLAAERQGLLEQAAQNHEAQARQTAELRLEVDRLAQDLNAQTALAAERQGLLEQAAQDHEAQARQTAELRLEAERLAQALNEQAALAGELEAKLAQTRDSESAAQAEATRLGSSAEALGLENDSLRLNLRQLQQEHESWYLKLQAYAGIEQSLVVAQAKIAAGEASLADRQQQIEQMTQAREGHAKLATAQLHASEARAAQLAQENEFLLLQLHQVQGDLERYFLQYRDLVGKGRQTQVQPGIPAGLASQPAEVVFDLRRGFNGDNWYNAEHDGRWAGPKEISSIKLPQLPGGHYEVLFDVVDAMDPEILLGMEASLNGKPLRLNDDWEGFPAGLHARFATEQLADSPLWEFQFKFPKLISPAQHGGSDDERRLAIRMRSVKLSLLD